MPHTTGTKASAAHMWLAACAGSCCVCRQLGEGPPPSPPPACDRVCKALCSSAPARHPPRHAPHKQIPPHCKGASLQPGFSNSDRLYLEPWTLPAGLLPGPQTCLMRQCVPPCMHVCAGVCTHAYVCPCAHVLCVHMSTRAHTCICVSVPSCVPVLVCAFMLCECVCLFKASGRPVP